MTVPLYWSRQKSATGFRENFIYDSAGSGYEGAFASLKKALRRVGDLESPIHAKSRVVNLPVRASEIADLITDVSVWVKGYPGVYGALWRSKSDKPLYQDCVSRDDAIFFARYLLLSEGGGKHCKDVCVGSSPESPVYFIPYTPELVSEYTHGVIVGSI